MWSKNIKYIYCLFIIHFINFNYILSRVYNFLILNL